MLPTRPRLAARSISSSCTCPAASTATRVSCGVTLTRISSLTLCSHALQQLRRFIQRQPHDAGKAAAQLGDELRGAALDRICAGLVVALAGRDVLPDFLSGEDLEFDFRNRYRALQLRFVPERDRREHFMPASGERG